MTPSAPLNLLFTATAYPPSTGGAQIHAHQLAVELSRAHSVQVMSFWTRSRTDWLLGTTLNAPADSESYVLDGVPVRTLAFSAAQKARMLPYVLAYYPRMAWAANALARCIQPQLETAAPPPDLIHNFRIGREPLSLASLNLARARGVPFFLTPFHHPRWKGWRYRVYDQIYRAADGLIALTHAEKNLLVERGVSPDRITVTGTAPILAAEAFPQHFLTAHGIDGPLILFLGQHYAYKGFVQLLQAAPLVWQKFPDAHFAFIGPPVGDSETHFAAHPDRRIHRLGAVSLQEKTNALAACTLLCLPSSQESFGGVFTEAWSYQKPVIGCPIPAVAELIADGVDGLLAPQQPPALADYIIALLQTPARAAQMGRAGYEKVNAAYTWQRLAQRYEAAYRRALA